MRSIELPNWMTYPYLQGNEDPPAGGTGTPPVAVPPVVDPPVVDPPDPDDPKDPEDTAGLRSTMIKERDQRKALEKQSKLDAKELKEARARLQEIDDKDKTEGERAAAAEKKAQEKVAKLAAGFKSSALRTAIEKAARELKFIDPEDAISGIDLSDIEVEQDEDDPAKVTVDTKAIQKAVKALSEKKKYLVGDGTPGDPSGSKFGGGGKTKEQLSEEALRTKYPALNR